jgi:hypothetical protein
MAEALSDHTEPEGLALARAMAGNFPVDGFDGLSSAVAGRDAA